MLGENIYKLRKQKHLSQEQLAELVEVTRQTISNWELGVTSPNPDQLKLLSQALEISIDELLGNNTKSIIEEKVSNTERLAGIIIKILKFIGIAFLVMLVIDFAALIFFVVVKEEMPSTQVEEITMVCHKDNNNYVITVGSNNHFNCSNCSTKLQKDLLEIVDYSNIDSNSTIITEYFENHNGTCD